MMYIYGYNTICNDSAGMSYWAINPEGKLDIMGNTFDNWEFIYTGSMIVSMEAMDLNNLLTNSV